MEFKYRMRVLSGYLWLLDLYVNVCPSRSNFGLGLFELFEMFGFVITKNAQIWRAYSRRNENCTIFWGSFCFVAALCGRTAFANASTQRTHSHTHTSTHARSSDGCCAPLFTHHHTNLINNICRAQKTNISRYDKYTFPMLSIYSQA